MIFLWKDSLHVGKAIWGSDFWGAGSEVDRVWSRDSASDVYTGVERAKSKRRNSGVLTGPGDGSVLDRMVMCQER